MSIIDATFEKHKKLMLEHLNSKKKILKEGIETEFSINIKIDPKKMGKNLPIQEDVEVEVWAEGSYEDNSFDYEYGSERGTHDPGSGFVADEMKITAASDIFVYDENGNQTSEILFKAGEEIKEELIDSNDMESINNEASDRLADSARSRYDNYE